MLYKNTYYEAMKTHTKTTPPNKKITLLLLGLLVIIVLLGLVGHHERQLRNWRGDTAKAANANGLNGLTLPTAKPLAQQSHTSCSYVNWRRVCTVTESRAYTLPADVTAFESAMSQALVVHGWSSSFGVNSPDGYFSTSTSKHGLVSAGLVHLGYAENATAPLQSDLQLTLSSGLPPRADKYFSATTLRKLQAAGTAGYTLIMTNMTSW